MQPGKAARPAVQILVANQNKEWAHSVAQAFEPLGIPVASCTPEQVLDMATFGFNGLLVLLQGKEDPPAAGRVKEIRQAGKRCPVLVLCPDEGPDAAAEILDAGADDYVTIPFDARELQARGRALLRRSSDQWLIPGAGTEVRLDTENRVVQVGPKSIKLTPTEFSIFQYLAERRGSWVSSDKIIAEVIGTHHAPRTALVRVHVHHIRRKLADCGWCLRAEHGRGYMLSI
jgi:two-component system response regulator TctD